MKTRKWVLVALLSGFLPALGSCATDVGYYLLTTFAEYLPDIMSALLGTSSSTA